MCGKALPFRERLLLNSWGYAPNGPPAIAGGSDLLCPQNWGVAPTNQIGLAGRPEAFRTSGGRAASLTSSSTRQQKLYQYQRGLLSFAIMSSYLDQLTAEAMKLPLRDRVQLAQRLVSTLDDEVESGT
jgi:hypothetical protein